MFASSVVWFASSAVDGEHVGPGFASRATMFAMPTTIHGLIHLARRALGVGSQGDFGELMGVSRRTGQRWETGRATPVKRQIEQMARLVHPADRGLEKPPAPPPPPPPPAPPAPPVEDIVDSIVCAAADAMNVLPRDVRPALLAAFTRTRRLGLGVEVVERALAATKPPSPSP
jgi:transcriptional regulator with XRE-family HTH domain